MALESRPGSPTSISIGGNYAQPSNSSGSLPEGTALMRECWGGDRNAGAPNYTPVDPQFFYELLIDGDSRAADSKQYPGAGSGTMPQSSDAMRRILGGKTS